MTALRPSKHQARSGGRGNGAAGVTGKGCIAPMGTSTRRGRSRTAIGIGIGNTSSSSTSLLSALSKRPSGDASGVECHAPLRSVRLGSSTIKTVGVDVAFITGALGALVPNAAPIHNNVNNAQHINKRKRERSFDRISAKLSDSHAAMQASRRTCVHITCMRLRVRVIRNANPSIAMHAYVAMLGFASRSTKAR